MKISRAIKKYCRELATELMLQEYELYDQIWAERIRITPALLDHGNDIVSEINHIMPNLLVHHATNSPIDLVSEAYGFESTSDLVDFLLAYKPRKGAFNKYYNELLESYLGVNDEIDDLPF